jgi:tetratricopeptide (TPR) repeat protein
MYWVGAVANAQLHHSIYPGWQLRFYTDTENTFTQKLNEYGCEVKIMENLGGFHGTFWRFLPASERGLDAIIVRDADSLLNVREAAAVAAWLESGKAAHVMRDFPHHLSWPMLGGMWGVRGGIITDIEDKIRTWGRWQEKHADQHFLQRIIWPLVANDCLQHTRGHSRWGGEPFPAHGPCDCDYVGEPYYDVQKRTSSSRSLVNRNRKVSSAREHAVRIEHLPIDHSINPELDLLFACCKALSDRAAEPTIRQILEDFSDWAAFARRAVGHELADIAAHTLARVAADLVPDDILNALLAHQGQVHAKNRTSFNELAKLMEAFESAGVEALPFGGPTLAIQAYGDLSMASSGKLDLLIRPADIAPAIDALRRHGYERKEQLTAAQSKLMHHLRGQDTLFNESLGLEVTLHSRLTPLKMALDIDYAAFWRRARHSNLNGHTMLTLAPEDNLFVIAIQGGRELWWNMKWACDAAAVITAYPKLDWIASLDRARAQGCQKMFLLTVSLARQCFGSSVPESIINAERAAPGIDVLVGRIVARWQADKATGQSSRLERLRLHDGIVRRARYIARTLLLPAPQQVAALYLPRSLWFAYVPIKVAHDLVALPLRHAYRQGRAQTGRLLYAFAVSDLALTMMPASVQTKLRMKRYQNARAAAYRAMAADPKDAAAWCKLGDALCGLRRHGEAIAYYDKALGLAPSDTRTSRKRAAAIKAAGAVRRTS